MINFYELLGLILVISILSFLFICLIDIFLRYIGLASAWIYIVSIKNVSNLTYKERMFFVFKILFDYKDILDSMYSSEIRTLKYKIELDGSYFPKITIYK